MTLIINYKNMTITLIIREGHKSYLATWGQYKAYGETAFQALSNMLGFALVKQWASKI